MRRMDGGVIPPTRERLLKIAKDHHMEVSDEEVASFEALIEGTLPAYRRVAQMTEPVPEVKYARTPGKRPEEKDNPLNAWYWRCEVQGAPEGPLRGKRVAVKDPIAVAGVPMMVGSAIMEGFIPNMDATVVTRMLDAGATLVGKAACEDLSVSGGAVTCNPLPAKNPHKPTHSAGGSSGGCGALLANKDVDLALGSDQGGSTRIPAALNGVLGLKATYGLVPATGAMPLENTIDHVCPMATNVHDLAVLLSVVAGDDPLDPRMRYAPAHGKDYTRGLTGDVKGKKVALVREGFGLSPDAKQTDEFVLSAARALTKAGAKVDDISLPFHLDCGAAYTPLLMDGIAHQMFQSEAFGMGWRGHYPTDWMDFYGKAKKAKANSFSHFFKYILLCGEYFNQEYNHRFYAKSQNMMRVFKAQYDEALREYDALIMPTCAPLAQALPMQDNYSADALIPAGFSHHLNTGQFNGTGHPSISIPAGMLDGLPVGMMLTGRCWEETALLNVALAYEQVL